MSTTKPTRLPTIGELAEQARQNEIAAWKANRGDLHPQTDVPAETRTDAAPPPPSWRSDATIPLPTIAELAERARQNEIAAWRANRSDLPRGRR